VYSKFCPLKKNNKKVLTPKSEAFFLLQAL